MAKRKKDDRVLCLRAADVWPQPWTQFVPASGFFGPGRIRRFINERAVWVSRREAERDPGYKQIIPYFVLHQGATVLHYWRSEEGAEKRLRGKASIGIGGHVEIVDRPGPGECGCPTWMACWISAERELREETGLRAALASLSGVVNHDGDEVGRVHIGIVFQIEVPIDTPLRYSLEIHEPSWQDPARIDRDALEPWSRLVADWLTGP